MSVYTVRNTIQFTLVNNSAALKLICYNKSNKWNAQLELFEKYIHRYLNNYYKSVYFMRFLDMWKRKRKYSRINNIHKCVCMCVCLELFSVSYIIT